VATAQNTKSTETAKGPEKPTEIEKRGWRDILKRAFQQIKHDDLTDRAAALTYYGVLAIFPGLLVVVAVIGLMGHNTTQQLLDNIGQIAPSGVKTFLSQVIQQAQNRGSAGLAAVLGLVIAVWSASGYVAAFMRSMNAIYGVDEGRPIWKTAPVRLAVTLAIMVLIVLSAFMVVTTGRIADQVGRALGIGHVAVTTWDILKWPVLLVLVSIMISLLYWAAPNVKQPGIRWITPGGVMAVLIWLVASGGFALYVSFSGSYSKTYGALATVIIFLVWLWITNLAILIGAEFNAEAEHQKVIDAGLSHEVEPFVEVRDTRKMSEDERSRVEDATEKIKSATDSRNS
jgi:membrane protein